VIVSLHTTSQGCHVALLPEDAEPLSATAPQASEALPGLVGEVLARAGGQLPRVALLAVACGPGSFTGIKIGLASAWGLARPHGLRVAGVGSLDALAAAGAAGVASGERVVAVAGAYAGLVYAARFVAGEVPEAVTLEGEYRVGRPDALLPELLAGARAVALEGTPLAEVARPFLGSADVRRVEPGAALAIAVARVAAWRDRRGLPQAVAPLYLRADPTKAW
jgi:tRNA threonylcarbamoyladenosine biosynthesis protein TsaB